jgi:hypothetical protein
MCGEQGILNAANRMAAIFAAAALLKQEYAYPTKC